jgi:ubiquinone/menaquinone biosynthesis methyltransferase
MHEEHQAVKEHTFTLALFLFCCLKTLVDMKNPETNIYSPRFVEDLFTQMSSTYNRMNSITSFGFSIRWRRQCAAAMPLKPGMKIVDLMTGMGEAWPFVLPKIGPSGELIALDFCAAMTRFAEQRRSHYPGHSIQILQEDALGSSIPDQYADAVISTFGLKTFSEAQLAQLSSEIWRILKPGGTFALIEVSTPRHFMLRSCYIFYLKRIIPILGKLFLPNPESYRMLGVYTTEFGDCRSVKTTFENTGFAVQYRQYFGGCASGIVGTKV